MTPRMQCHVVRGLPKIPILVVVAESRHGCAIAPVCIAAASNECIGVSKHAVAEECIENTPLGQLGWL